MWLLWSVVVVGDARWQIMAGGSRVGGLAVGGRSFGTTHQQARLSGVRQNLLQQQQPEATHR